MVSQNELIQLTRLVTGANRILVGSHANCGDATGSVTALALVLRNLDKVVTVFLPEPVAASFKFLPGTESVINDSAQIDFKKYDLYLSVDAAEPKLTGLADKFNERPSSLITVNFDHHHTSIENVPVSVKIPVNRQVATCRSIGQPAEVSHS